MQLSLCVLLLLGLSACSLAYPQAGQPLLVQAYEDPHEDLQNLVASQLALDELVDLEHHRERRQLNVQGGGSPRQGFDLSVNGRAPVWQSQNGRHSLDATGQYSQHLGGPYGNSRPNWGAGAQYTFRF